jgi:Flp pilus assembly protein TadD
LADAEAAFRRAQDLDPADPQPQFNLTVLLRETGRTDEARDALLLFLAKFPDHSGAHNYLGCIVDESGDRESAWKCFAQSVELAPDDVPARLNLIRVLCDLGRYPESTTHLQVLAQMGMHVVVDATDNEVFIKLDGRPFYRGVVRQG